MEATNTVSIKFKNGDFLDYISETTISEIERFAKMEAKFRKSEVEKLKIMPLCSAAEL